MKRFSGTLNCRGLGKNAELAAAHEFSPLDLPAETLVSIKILRSVFVHGFYDPLDFVGSMLAGSRVEINSAETFIKHRGPFCP